MHKSTRVLAARQLLHCQCEGADEWHAWVLLASDELPKEKIIVQDASRLSRSGG